jgi:hypothetical protein
MKSSSDTGLIESQTWMLTIQNDGTLVVDLIQGLADYPRRTPKISTIIRMPSSLSHTVANDPLRAIAFYKSANNAIDLDYATPNQITIYTHNRSGTIAGWDLSLGRKTNSPQLNLVNVFTGHTGPITEIAAHPRLPLIASIDSNTHLIIWHARNTAIYVPDNILTNVVDCNVKGIEHISWHPTAPALFANTSKGIELFLIVPNNPLKHDLTPVCESTIFPPLANYYNIQHTGLLLDESEEFINCVHIDVLPTKKVYSTDDSKVCKVDAVVVAVSKDGNVGIWNVEQSADGQFTANLLTNRSLDGTITSVHCRKVVPFVYDSSIKTDITGYDFDQKETENAEKNCIVIAVGRDDGTVVVYRALYEQKQAPKPSGGGLLAKLQQTTPSSSEKSFVVKQWLKFSASTSAVNSIRINDNLSRIALRTEDSANSATIYESESNNTFSMEQIVQLEHPVLSVEWSGIGDGDDVLCIGTIGKILYFTNKRAEPKTDLSGPKLFWQKIASVHGIKSTPCYRLCSTKERSIVGAFDKSLYVYTKWTHYGQDTEQTIRSVIASAHRRIPDYHPK